MIITRLAVASQMLTDPRSRSPSVLAVVVAIICGKCRESRLTRCGVRSLFALVTPLRGGYEIY